MKFIFNLDIWPFWEVDLEVRIVRYILLFFLGLKSDMVMQTTFSPEYGSGTLPAKFGKSRK